MKILITGCNGFIGRHVVDCLKEQTQHSIVGTARHRCNELDEFIILDLDADFDITAQLVGIDAIVHCAARVHIMQDSAMDSLEQYRRINSEGTLKLAQQAAVAGVKRFIFISTIKVNGEYTQPGKPFYAKVTRPPEDPYALSKFEAELSLVDLAKSSGMEVVTIRPPLVYGPGVKANFMAMMNFVRRRIPLPLGDVDNRRSLVYIGNLAHLVLTCLAHPNAANKTFLVSDDEDVSTTQLLKKIAKAMNYRSYLLPIPSKILLLISKLLGKPDVGERLCNSLQLDISETKAALQWLPPYTLDEALKLTVSNKK